jgi:valyl-tRNA synthetase
MSKSLGNVIDPLDVIEKFGAESFRLWIAVEGNLEKTDFRCSFERIEGAGKFLTKLWNIARFISMFSEPNGKIVLTHTDLWILDELNNLVKYSRKRYRCYDFHGPVTKIKHFVWETFASHYLELVKNRVYNEDKKFSVQEQNGAIYTLNHCLDIILKLLAPVIPMITYRIYKDLKNKDIHFTSFPKPEKIEKTKLATQEIIELNSRIWKAKKDKGLSLKTEIKTITIPAKFKSIEHDLKAAHKIKEIKYGKKLSIVINMPF